MSLDSRLSYDEQITSVASTCIAELCKKKELNIF